MELAIADNGAVAAITDQLSTGTIDDVAKITREWIESKPNHEEQLKAVIDLTEGAVDRDETIGEIVTEAWSLLVNGEFWRARYPSIDAAIDHIDNSSLRNIRRHASNNRARKANANLLEIILDVAKKYEFNVAKHLLISCAVRRLSENRGGRGSTKEIVRSDWKAVGDMDDGQREKLLTQPLPTAEEIGELDLNLGLLTLPPPLIVESHQVQGEAAETTNDLDSSDEIDANESSASESRPRKKSRLNAKASPCGCSDVPASLLERLGRKSATEASMRHDHEVLAVVYVLLNTTPKGYLKNVCRNHLKIVASYLGLKTNEATTEILQYRLKTAWDNRVTIDAFKAGPETHQWFKLKERPAVKDDDLVVYKFWPRPASLLKSLRHDCAQVIVAELARPDAWAQWKQDGNLIINGLFDWLWTGTSLGGSIETGIGDMMAEEFDVYLHHQRERNGKPNYGWCRTMIYSLSQQVIRTDLSYWMLYAALRPNHNMRLVAYPYYTKYAVEHDRTGFAHVDMNIDQYLQHGHGGNIIQGSMSLDNETEDACTLIVPGFHRNIERWWQDVERRGEKPRNAEITPIHDVSKLYNSTDMQAYGTYVPVPCQRGGIRVTRPEILHGSTKVAGKQPRRTILPWFVGVRDDGVTLDNEESETWNDLAGFYNRLEAPRKTPSGLPNKYGCVPFPFPAATKMNLDAAVSNALLAQTTWNDPSVQLQANVLLGPDRGKAREIVMRARLDVLRKFKLAYEKMKKVERFCYQSESFFAPKPECK
ncbi:MAG: hypothetical protein Q9195_007482 [Heterodermia aff. obscurata]